MLPGMEMLVCPNVAVAPEVMQHIVQVESGGNPFAIGVVDGQLVRQPRNLGEALATAQMLERQGYNFSVGIAQVNRANLRRYGLDSYRKAFNTCDSMAAGAQILASCYHNAHGDWGKAFSCYYSGNFTTGFRTGYVQKIYASISHEAKSATSTARRASTANLATPSLASVPANHTDSPADNGAALRPVVVYSSDSAQYRVALRSTGFASATTATMPLVVSAAKSSRHTENAIAADAVAEHPSGGAAGQVTDPTMPDPGKPRSPPLSSVPPRSATAGTPQTRDDGVFEPRVRGPNDQLPASTAEQAPTEPTLDRSDLRKEARDDAFVF